ncbi:LuxR family transcriptional regulator [Mycobacterium sp. ST-F2]|uniref:helix-turn-helix transcriptional regulator n=1 Tax=Mycobacterium sp. ST-F2 TaxID=1490484 RepID=UPI00093D450F|nr:helix-turn-helix transcriptional regulator [Mycobacterium sp. ST-F2]OKH82534.1 LuxR family transcriptional regulator [Mycobacterium sp. ST-F2]
MTSALTEERVRSDLDVLSRAGLTVDDFLAEATAAVKRAVPWIAACVGTHDPSTVLMTSGRKYGALAERDSCDELFAQIEYSGEEPTAFRELVLDETASIGMSQATGGDLERSTRMERLIRPVFGFGDESRLVFRDKVGVWGAMALFRDPGDAAFSTNEIDYLATLADAFARGIRLGTLARLAGSSIADMTETGPVVMIFDDANQVAQMSIGAEERIAELNTSPNRTDPMSVVHGLVAAARRIPGAAGAKLPRVRVRTGSGMWLVLHAAPLTGRDGTAGDVVVTIEEARPPEIVELVVAAFGLTARERDVTRMVLQGIDTKEISANLHVSTYTVQDHLKSVFDKAGVRSRRELISRVYFDQYIPRIGSEIGPSGWFVG